MRLHAIALALLVTALVAPARAVDPKAVYQSRCSFCHGESGRGDGAAALSLSPPPVDFTAAAFRERATAKKVRRAIAEGVEGTAMIPFDASLEAAEIDALVDYILQLGAP